jgi:hypothetical protein
MGGPVGDILNMQSYYVSNAIIKRLGQNAQALIERENTGQNFSNIDILFHKNDSFFIRIFIFYLSI